MKITRIFLFLMVLLQVSACSDICDCFNGEGKLVVEERSLGTISGIHLADNVDVIIYQSLQSRLRVTAGDKLIGEIGTKVVNGVLYIQNDNRCNWVRKLNPTLTVEVWTQDIQSIYADNSSGDITCVDTIHASNFRIDTFNSLGIFRLKIDADISTIAINNGPCDIYVEGKCNTQYTYNAGFGLMDCGKFISNNNYVHNKGTNNIFVNSESVLEVRIDYTGNIYYKGNPATIKTDITGSGKLIKL